MATYYVAPQMRLWENLQFQMFGIPGSEDLAKVKGPAGSPGILIVFESMEDLLEAFPDTNPNQVLVLQANTKKEEEDEQV